MACGIFGALLSDRTELDLEAVISSVGLDGQAFAESNSLAAGITYYGLYHLQNRGQDSSGIVVLNKSQVSESKGLGLVSHVHRQEALENLIGNLASGHNRYSTTGKVKPQNTQPFVIRYPQPITLSHNGNLVNQDELLRKLKKQLKAQGLEDKILLNSTTDSELILNLIALHMAKERCSIEEALHIVLNQLVGSYSLIITAKDKLIGIRDPEENRPLYVGKISGCYFLSSERVVIERMTQLAGYRMKPSDFIQEVKGGEIITIQRGEIRAIPFNQQPIKLNRCSFSKSYLNRADEKGVYEFRIRCGEELYQEHPFASENAVVIGVPDSGLIAAEGYARASGIPLSHGVFRNHYYLKRTFIEPYHQGRNIGTLMKQMFIEDALKGKTVVLVDDSIVRSITSSNLIKYMRLAGKVQGLHLRIATPPYRTPCWLGIHTPEKEELIAYGLTAEQLEIFFMARFFGVDCDGNILKDLVKKGENIEDIVRESLLHNQNYLTDEERGPVDPKRFSLKYLSLERFEKCFGDQKDNMCYACFIPDGKGYPEHMQKYLVGKV